jgi:hypothetical protein
MSPALEMQNPACRSETQHEVPFEATYYRQIPAVLKNEKRILLDINTGR